MLLIEQQLLGLKVHGNYFILVKLKFGVWTAIMV